MPDRSVILLAEDDEDHILLVRRAFKHANLLNPLFVVRDGAEAIEYLNGEGPYANRAEYPLPALLLLDLRMPRKNGFEVLEWIRQQPGLRRLRIVVLTTSDAPNDIDRAYELGANAFMVKPLERKDFLQVTDAIKGYWLWMSATPNLQTPRQEEIDKASAVHANLDHRPGARSH